MEFLGGWNKEEGDEEGDGIILVYLFGRIWVCALVLCLRLLFWFGFWIVLRFGLYIYIYIDKMN